MFNYLSSYLVCSVQNEMDQQKNEELSNNRNFDKADEMNQYNNNAQFQTEKKKANQ